MHRNTHNIGRRTVLWLYVGSGAAAGALTGAGLGWVGSLIAAEARVAVASAAALAGLLGAFAGLSGRWRPPLQCDRETPQRWVFEGPLAWSLKNGAALGQGAFTRLGFVLWYAVPIGALLVGSPLFGAALYAGYALARTGGAAVIWIAGQRRGTIDPMLRWLERQHERSQRVAALNLLALSLVTLVVVGL